MTSESTCFWLTKVMKYDDYKELGSETAAKVSFVTLVPFHSHKHDHVKC